MKEKSRQNYQKVVYTQKRIKIQEIKKFGLF